MAANNDPAPADRQDGLAQDDAPKLRERRATGTKLRIVHNRDALEGTANMESRSPDKGPNKQGGMLDHNLQGKIGRMLRDVFSDVAEEPVPERFRKLLEALETREKSR